MLAGTHCWESGGSLDSGAEMQVTVMMLSFQTDMFGETADPDQTAPTLFAIL